MPGRDRSLVSFTGCLFAVLAMAWWRAVLLRSGVSMKTAWPYGMSFHPPAVCMSSLTPPPPPHPIPSSPFPRPYSDHSSIRDGRHNQTPASRFPLGQPLGSVRSSWVWVCSRGCTLRGWSISDGGDSGGLWRCWPATVGCQANKRSGMSRRASYLAGPGPGRAG